MRSATKYILVAALVSTGAVAWGQDRPAGSAVEETDEHMDRIARTANKFKGSIFLWDNSISGDTLNPNGTLSYVPSYQWWFSFRPRYYFTKNLSLRARMDLTTEWMNDGGQETTLRREAMFGDLWLDLAYNPRKFWGIVPTVALRTVWGTSKESIANTDIFNVGPVVGLVREFETKKAGTFELSLSMYGLYHFVQYTMPGTVNGLSYNCDSIDLRNTTCTTTQSPQNTQFNLTTFIAAKWSIKQVSVSLNYAVLDSWGYQNPDITLPNGQKVQQWSGDTRFRQSGWFIASIDYDPKDWVSFSLGYYCLRPILDPDGSYGDPFYKPGANTRIFLTTTFNLDRVYDAAARRMQKNKVAEGSPNVTGASFAWSR
jgi:hypothetical protein